MNDKEKADRYFLELCLKLARRGRGKVSPNPLVGAVLVKNGKVIGKGWHKKYGGSHAEVLAIRNAKESVAGSTLYSNLEPCCHTNKQTPPCVPLIIQKEIKRVVISNIDPNKNVNGNGVKLLRNAGIEVVTGILEEEGKKLNKFYFKFIRKNIPYVTVKIAQSLDGKISEAKNKQTWLTGKKSIRFVHSLRSEYDAVLVGANTIKTDNPRLTVREVKGRNPVRIILDGRLSIPVKSRVVTADDPQNTWVFTSTNSSQRKAQLLSERQVKLFRINSADSKKLPLKKIMKIIAGEKITSVLVEGGAGIFSHFIQNKIFDEIIVLQSPKVLGQGIGIRDLKTIKNLKLLSSEELGQDSKQVYGKKYSG